MTFYLDASIQIAVRTALDSVREDVVYAGGPNAPKESTQDRHWLATVGNEGWVVIKRDKRIRTRPWEREALIAAGARTFCLTGAGNYNRWDTLRLLAARWDRIEQVAEKIPGPYIYAVTWQGVRRLSLAGASEPQKRGSRDADRHTSPIPLRASEFHQPLLGGDYDFGA